MRLQDKTIIVTGSTMGIGKAIAKRCLAEGGEVLLHGLEPDVAQETQRELDPEGERTEIVVADLEDRFAPKRIIESAISRFGKIDALVNNAAVVGTGKIESTDEAKWDRMLAVNAKAPFFLIKQSLPHLERSLGCVLNIGSVNAYCGEPDLLPYSISKGALQTMSRNLGDTLHRQYGIRVNQINPGWILTENERQRKQDQGLPEDWPKLLHDHFAPTGRIFDPAEIAAAAIYFLSDESGPVSGSVLDVEQYPMIGRNFEKTIEE